MELPKFIGLKSNNYNNKYLRYIHEDNEAHGLHQFSSDAVVSGYAKFEVEKAKIGNGYVHIRSVYNNKYWVRRSPTEWWITANADEPDEDEFTWTCTLFEPIRVDGFDNSGLTIRLRHVQLSHFVCLWRIPPPYAACLFAASPDPDESHLDIFPIFDWDSLFILPKHIAFKGDNGTGSYLRRNRFQGMNYLTFDSTDISNNAVANEVFATPLGDGTVTIKSVFFNKLWSRASCGNWIVAGSCNSNANDPNTLFFPTKVSNNVVALRNLGNHLFCKRYTDEGVVGGLSAVSPTITIEAQLEVYELVAHRAIENVEFHLSDGRIYNKKVTTVATGFAENRLQQPAVIDVKLSYDDTRVSAWSSTVSVKLDVETTVIKSSVPIIFEEILAIGSEFSGEYDWGEDKNWTRKVDTVHKVLVQPRSRVRVNLVATQASYDVPFSYTQNDTLISGQNITLNMEDGIYKGVNFYNFKFETEWSRL